MSRYQPVQPKVLIATGVVTLTNYYSWATFLNDGAASGTIDFGGGNILTLAPSESLTMPNLLNRPYSETIVDGTGTTIKIVYCR